MLLPGKVDRAANLADQVAGEQVPRHMGMLGISVGYDQQNLIAQHDLGSVRRTGRGDFGKVRVRGIDQLAESVGSALRAILCRKRPDRLVDAKDLVSFYGDGIAASLSRRKWKLLRQRGCARE